MRDASRLPDIDGHPTALKALSMCKSIFVGFPVTHTVGFLFSFKTALFWGSIPVFNPCNWALDAELLVRMIDKAGVDSYFILLVLLMVLVLFIRRGIENTAKLFFVASGGGELFFLSYYLRIDTHVWKPGKLPQTFAVTLPN